MSFARFSSEGLRGVSSGLLSKLKVVDRARGLPATKGTEVEISVSVEAEKLKSAASEYAGKVLSSIVARFCRPSERVNFMPTLL